MFYTLEKVCMSEKEKNSMRLCFIQNSVGWNNHEISPKYWTIQLNSRCNHGIVPFVFRNEVSWTFVCICNRHRVYFTMSWELCADINKRSVVMNGEYILHSTIVMNRTVYSDIHQLLTVCIVRRSYNTFNIDL